MRSVDCIMIIIMIMMYTFSGIHLLRFRLLKNVFAPHVIHSVCYDMLMRHTFRGSIEGYGVDPSDRKILDSYNVT